MKVKTRKSVIFAVTCVLAFIALFPIKGGLRDGGTISYTALTGVYTVYLWHSLTEEYGVFRTGVTVRIFGMDIYDRTGLSDESWRFEGG